MEDFNWFGFCVAAMKFSEKYFGMESCHVFNHPAMNTLNMLCNATAALNHLVRSIFCKMQKKTYL